MMNKIKKFMDNYNTINDSNFKGNEIGKLLTKDVKSIIEKELGNLKVDDIKEIKASIGNGRKADVPWLGIRINDMIDKVNFLNFAILFSADGKIMYLTLNQKYQFYKDTYGNSLASIKAKESSEIIADLLFKDVTIPRDIKKGSIDLRCKNKRSLGNGYESTTVLFKKYDIENLPTKEQFIKDILNFVTLLKEIKRIKNNRSISEFINEILNNESKYEIALDDKQEIKEVIKKYYEGGKRTVTTVSNKTIRNSQLARDYKNYFKEQHEGKIFCEVCGQWEEIGEQMLDVHHKIKVSDYEKENKEYSTFEDVILLCPSCHRLVHIFENIDDVKKIYER